ncbi:MAG: hypothetical protein PHO86_03195 [Bacilli bacterium]|nr:hypothetical protein [Bacilli bacterium]
MKMGIYQITSAIHDIKAIEESSQKFLQKIQKISNIEFYNINKEEFNKYYANLIFIRTGGTEGDFKNLYQDIKGPFYLLTSGDYNSLAASMEILSFLKQKGEKAEILHGGKEYIAHRIEEIYHESLNTSEVIKAKLGVIGKPSDWLISSDVNYREVQNRLGIELIDIEMEELFQQIGKKYIPFNDIVNEVMLTPYDDEELQKSLEIYGAFKLLIEKYDLSGLTVRCFDLLKAVKNTGCLGLAILNSEGYIGTCEGDIPALLTMFILREVVGVSGFQANPSRIDIEKNEIVFAHCTLPLSMAKEYTLTTHFESNLGVAIKGALPLGPATVFKISNDLKKCFVSRAEIIENLDEKTLCRTQIRLKMEKDVSYFLVESLGNHHLIVLGDHVEELEKYFTEI